MSLDAKSVLSLCTDADMSRVQLTNEDMSVIARVDGRATVNEIATLTGQSVDATVAVLQRLQGAGVVDTPESAEKRNKKHLSDVKKAKKSDDPYEGFTFPRQLMSLDCGLDDEKKKKIIFTHHKLDEWNHYELLDIDRRSEDKEIKRAYYAASKDWHPDRMSRKDMGPLKPMVQDIYKRVREAYQVLGDAKTRLEYDKAHVYQPSDEELKEIIWESEKDQREERRKAERKARRLRKNPVLQRRDKSRGQYEDALRLKEEGKFVEALRAAQMAMTYAPDNPDLKKLVEQLKGSATQAKLGPIMKKGAYYESLTQHDDAVRYFEQAIRVQPDHVEAHVRLAFNLLGAKREADEVMPVVQRALELVPNQPEAHYVLARCYENNGMGKLAKKHYEEAVKAKPDYSEAKKRLKRLKWGF